MRKIASEFECLKKEAMIYFEKSFTPIIESRYIGPLHTKASDYPQLIRSSCASYFNRFVDLNTLFPEGDMFLDQVILENTRIQAKRKLGFQIFLLKDDIETLVWYMDNVLCSQCVL